MESSSKLSTPSWPFTESPSPGLNGQKLVSELQKTEEDVEGRLLQLKRTVHGTSFFLSTAAERQKERLQKYKELLLDYRTKLQQRADWLRDSQCRMVNGTHIKDQGDVGGLFSVRLARLQQTVPPPPSQFGTSITSQQCSTIDDT